MKKKFLKKALSLLLTAVLIVAMAYGFTACNDETKDDGQILTGIEKDYTYAPEESNLSPTPLLLGEGKNTFLLTVTDFDGNETMYTINTDMETVGDALKELNLIEGDEGAYGLYVKKVMGITADYDTDGKYWAFYIDGEYATSGIDKTEIVEGQSYGLKVQK